MQSIISTQRIILWVKLFFLPPLYCYKNSPSTGSGLRWGPTSSATSWNDPLSTEAFFVLRSECTGDILRELNLGKGHFRLVASHPLPISPISPISSIWKKALRSPDFPYLSTANMANMARDGLFDLKSWRSCQKCGPDVDEFLHDVCGAESWGGYLFVWLAHAYSEVRNGYATLPVGGLKSEKPGKVLHAISMPTDHCGLRVGWKPSDGNVKLLNRSFSGFAKGFLLQSLLQWVVIFYILRMHSFHPIRNSVSATFIPTTWTTSWEFCFVLQTR